MTTQLNHTHKTHFNFNFEHDLPYKKSIRPEIAYGEWTKRPDKILLKVMLSDKDHSLLTNPHNINCLGAYVIGNEIWFDLQDIYLVMPYDKKIEQKINKKNCVIAFYYNNKLLSAIGK